jgi:two-component system sensor histidine kinase RegB
LHILFELALLYPALHYGWMFASDVSWYLGALAGLLVFNLITGLWRRQGLGISPAFLLLQIAVDLSAMALLYGVSGGLTNPVHSLVHFQIGLAGIILSPLLALISLGLGLGVLTLLGWGTQSLTEAYAWVGPLGPNLAYEWALAGAVSGLSIFAARLNRHYRDRLSEAQQRIRQQDRLRAAGAVASGFCHELASPLNAAGLLTDRLQRKIAPGQPPFDLSEEWSELKDSLNRCDRIVRAMAGAPWDPEELGLQTVDPGVLLHKIAAQWNGGAALQLSANVRHGLLVGAPAVGLAQVFMNLLRNAEEASHDHGVIEVSFVTHSEAGQPALHIRVSDRGIGVSPVVQRAIGTPFNSSKGAGRGLGLFSALHLTESLGGSLTLTARAGGGTDAILILPLVETKSNHSSNENRADPAGKLDQDHTI